MNQQIDIGVYETFMMYIPEQHARSACLITLMS